MKRISILVFLCTLLCTGAAFGQKKPIYTSYQNPRFEFSVLYPSNLLTMQPPSANGDGRIFLSADGETEMRAYGQHNALFKTLEDVYKEEYSTEGREITYKTIAKTWFVVSGYEGDKVFYQKQILRNDVFLILTIEYPKSRKKVFDPITAKIAASFK